PAGHVHAETAQRGPLCEDGRLVGLLGVEDPPVDGGAGEHLEEGGRVGVEPLREQHVERPAEPVAQLVQERRALGCEQGALLLAQQRGKRHRHSGTAVPSPWASASWANRWPSAMSVTTSPLL